jgi:hypothetical protein
MAFQTILTLTYFALSDTFTRVKHGLTVREEHKLRVFDNRELRRIFGPKRDGVTGGWRKLHN